MEILSENGFDSFKTLLKENRKLALLGLKTRSITPTRNVLVETDKWKCIINESYCLTSNNKVYLRRTRISELIKGKKMLYVKVSGKLKTLTPFNQHICDSRLITENDLYQFYGLDYLIQHKKFITGNTTITFIRKNKLTNYEKYFKLKFKAIPYRFFIERISHDKDINYLLKLNQMLKQSKNPNIILNFDDKQVSKLMNDSILFDLVMMCEILDKKINLSWSDKRIKLEHDKCSLEIQNIKKNFVSDKKFQINDRFKGILPDSYELIDNERRLFEEGDNLKHCVFTQPMYKSRIECGYSTIYSKTYKGDRYTLELTYNHSTKPYSIGQFSGFRNKPAPEELILSLNEHLDKINSTGNKEYMKSEIIENEMVDVF